jgi:hypothetical protein
MPITRADTVQPMHSLQRREEVAGHRTGLGDLGTALERGGDRDRTIDKRLLALVLPSQVHGTASRPKRR